MVTEAKRLVVIGASGCGRQTLDVVVAINEFFGETRYEVLGVVDDSPSETNLRRLADRDVAYLGTTSDWLNLAPPTYYTVGIGDPVSRGRIASVFDEAGHLPVSLIDPDAVVGTRAKISPGVVIRAGAKICTNVTLQRHVYVNFNVVVGHDTVCEDYVSLNPGALISGECSIREAALVGAGAVVLQGLEVGEAAVVGAGACVTRPVPAGRVAMGIPARCVELEQPRPESAQMTLEGE